MPLLSKEKRLLSSTEPALHMLPLTYLAPIYTDLFLILRQKVFI